jgi:hypothetical protein
VGKGKGDSKAGVSVPLPTAPHLASLATGLRVGVIAAVQRSVAGSVLGGERQAGGLGKDGASLLVVVLHC